jgi:uncharacterized delta-60 repeat protein
LENGDYDNSFANNGRYITTFNSGYSTIKSLQFQSDGKILAGGARIGDSGYLDYAMIRLTRDGILDSLEFGNNGMATYDSGAEDNRDYIRKIQVLPNDKILAAGFGGVVQYSKDGVLDTSFGSNGAIQMEAFDLAVQADGRMVFPVAYTDTFISNFIIARYNADGTPDSSFAIQGKTNTDYNHKDDQAFLVAVQPDQKIVAAGVTTFGSGSHYMLVRYLSGLELSTSDFSTNPISTLVYPNPVSNQATLQINLEQPTQIEVLLLDMNGRLIENCLSQEKWMSGRQQKTISFPSNLPPGTYLLKVLADEKSAAIKVVKQ